MAEECLTDQELRDLSSGRVPPAEADRLAAHIEACASCLARVQSVLTSGPAPFGAGSTAPPVAAGDADVVEALIARIKKSAGASSVDTAHFAESTPASRQRNSVATRGGLIAGRYTLLEPIGEGGMGEVWVADQSEPVKRRVAVKLIKAGMDSKAVLQRFEAERQALALMDHPNIARVFDGGMTDERRPFFVMELVRGAPLTKFCDDGRLDVRTRLELFVGICQAVQHAHQKGIIHRDLKPSNILVTTLDGRPVPKIIDFGVAKAIGGQLADFSLATQFGSVVGTLEYMSPEQADTTPGDIDTRSDIYSLGVILYELLTGLRPIDSARLGRAAVSEMVRIIREEEPSKPSTRLSTSDSAPSLAALRHSEPRKLSALLRGELDWVVMKCLEKSRDRRYETANGLARDIQRYLVNEPVEARPPSPGYLLSKFLRRHRGAVIAATLLFATLVAGIVGTSWQAYRANRAATAEREANLKTQKRLAQIERGVELFAGMLHGINPSNEQKGGPTVYEQLRQRAEAAADALDADAVGDPLAVARLQVILGITLRGLGGWSKAVGVMESATATRTRELGADHLDTIASQGELAQAYKDSGQLNRSLPLFEATLRAREQKLGDDHIDTLQSRHNLGRAYLHAGQHQKALLLFESTVRAREAKLGPNHPDTVATRSSLVAAYHAAGRYEEGIPIVEAILRSREESLGPDHLDTLSSRHNVAIAYYMAGQLDKAVPLLESSAQAIVAKLGAEHPQALLASGNLAMGYNTQRRFDKAAALYETTLKISEAKLGFNHTNTLLIRFHLASALVDGGRLAEALPLLEQASTEMAARKYQHDFAAGLLRTTIMACERAGRLDQAEAWRAKWLPHVKERSGAGSADYANELETEGKNSIREKNWVAGETLLRECHDIREKIDPKSWAVSQTKSLLGAALLGQKKLADAEPHLLSGYEGLEQREASLPKEAHDAIPQAIERLVELYRAKDQAGEVTRWQAERDKYPPAKK